ncbi:hypothetical protein [Pseudalkalibacillus sp. SCS-8]
MKKIRILLLSVACLMAFSSTAFGAGASTEACENRYCFTYGGD